MRQYYILQQHAKEPQPVTAVLTNATVDTLKVYLHDKKNQLWGFDLETSGLDAANPEQKIIGVGLATLNCVIYIDLLTADSGAIDYLKSWTTSAQLVPFNAMFDGTFWLAEMRQWPNIVGDSYALFKNLSSEGWPGSKWNLETAQYDILGWPESNKAALTEALQERGLSKSDMWKLPPEILGPYCASDADAALQLWNVLVDTCNEHEFTALLDYHKRMFLTEVRLLAEQQLRGIMVDQDRLAYCRTRLITNIESALDAFLSHPQVAPHIARFTQEAHTAWKRAEPTKYTAAGEISARWRRWKASEQSYVEKRGFNPNSKQQLEKLFYDNLGFEVTKRTTTGRRVIDKKILPTLGEPGRLINTYNLLVKQRGYVDATVEKSARDGLIHPQFNAVGTKSARIAGTGGWNFAQMPKSAEFLYALRARPGMKLIQEDATAIEPTILAEFSQDKALLKLYGEQKSYCYTLEELRKAGIKFRVEDDEVVIED